MKYVAQAADGRTVSFVERKRYLWMIVWLSPLMPMVSMGLYFLANKNPFALLLPLIFWFVCIPAFDGWFGEDRNNSSEEIRPLFVKDNYCRFIFVTEVVLNGIDFILMAFNCAKRPIRRPSVNAFRIR